MPPSGFKCKQCGNCCLKLRDAFETCATEEDIRLWEEKGREDILEWVDPIKLPRQNKYICRINDVKPVHCREYPRSRKHGEKTGCKGFEK